MGTSYGADVLWRARNLTAVHAASAREADRLVAQLTEAPVELVAAARATAAAALDLASRTRKLQHAIESQFSTTVEKHP